MSDLDYKTIVNAWKRMIDDPAKVMAMQVEAPSLLHPTAIRVKNVPSSDNEIRLRFYGFDAASGDSHGIPIIKRMIMNWLKRISTHVQIIDSGTSDLNLIVSNDMRFTEAAIPIFKRDPKTNKMKRAYKCIGGIKNGRRVSDPDQCLQYPSVDKKIKLAISKRTKHGQRTLSRTKTKLTNIMSRRVRKANQRLKNARGI
jgi:hypothetical protein